MAEVVALEFTDPAGERLRVEWDDQGLAGLDAPAANGKPLWNLSGDLDWDEIDALRILSGRLGTDRLMAFAALRPRSAGGHGEEVVAGALGDAAGFEQLEEVLISTEYGPDGAIRRIGLELYRDESGLPLRVAADAVGHGSDRQGGVKRESIALQLRSGGDEGVGVLDVLTPER